MRVTDIFLAFPALLLALALAAVLPPSMISVTIAIAVTWWPWYTRLIRGQAASVAGRPYIESCRALGISRRRIIFRHILPNAITPLIVQVSLDVGGVILTASALSFLGLGAQDPTPDWGLMVAEGQTYFTDRLVGRHLPRAGHPGHRVRVQPARRRPAGPAGPEADLPAMSAATAARGLGGPSGPGAPGGPGFGRPARSSHRPDRRFGDRASVRGRGPATPRSWGWPARAGRASR